MTKRLALVLLMILFVTGMAPRVFADESGEQEIRVDPELDIDTTDPVPESDLFTGNDDIGEVLDDHAPAEHAPAELPDNGIPVIIIQIDETEGHTIEEMNSSIDHSVECYGTMEIKVPEGFTYCDTDNAPQGLGPVALDYIRGRGNSTWNGPKKPYKIKLEKKQDVLGLGENKHWLLMANTFDVTSFKNRFTGWLGDALGMEYTPRGVPVDVVMVAKRDGEETGRQNLGNYLLAEQVRVDKNRVDIHELTKEDTDPADITGGYLVQFGSQTAADDPDKFYTDRDISLANVSPTFDPDDPDYTNEAQKEYIRTCIRNMENALFGAGADAGDEDFYVDQNGIRYNEYMDMQSAALYWLIQEASYNSDMYGTGSTYLYKKEDRFDAAGGTTETGRIFWGPLWDFDLAWGESEDPDMNYTGFGLFHDWLLAMTRDDDENGFRETAKRLWPDVRETILSALEPDGLIDQYYDEMKYSYSADYEIWKDSGITEYRSRTDFTKNTEGFKTWIRNRVNWLDAHILGYSEDYYPDLDHAVCRITFVADGDVFRREYCPTNAYYDVPARNTMDTTVILPEKEGAIFLGWHGGDGNIITSGQSITEDTTFYALFVPEEDAIPAEQILFRSSEEWTNTGGIAASNYTILPHDAQDKRMTWSSSDPSIAKVDQYGNVELLGVGTVTITAALHSGVTGSYELTVLDEERPVTEDLELVSDEIRLKPGEYAHVDYRIFPRYSNIRYIFFYSENSDAATVDENGVVTACAPGTAKIFAEVHYPDENGDEVSINKSCTVIVDDEKEDSRPVPIDGWEAVLSETTFIYNAGIQRPMIKTIGGRELKEGRDYTAQWSDLFSKNAGTYEVTITGQGDYTGTTKASYTIHKAVQTIIPGVTSVALPVGKTKKITITGAKGTLSYKNQNKTIAVVNDSGTITAKKVGTVKITVSAAATANYKKSAAKTITIKVLPAAVTEFKVTNTASGIRLTWKKAAKSSGYQIQYAENSKFTSGKKTVTIKSSKTTSRKITGLKAKKKYYVRIRTYQTVNGKKYYSSWSKAKSVTTKNTF